MTTRSRVWATLVALALAGALPAWADYDAGQKTWDAGRAAETLAEWPKAADNAAFARAKASRKAAAYAEDSWSRPQGRQASEAKGLREKAEKSERLADKYPPGTKLRDCEGCPEMVVVPAGSFMMGSPESEDGRNDDEGPVHRVTIAQPFAAGVKEVTRGEYGRFIEATGHSTGDSCWTYEGEQWEDRSGRDWRGPAFRQTDEHPVVCVSWEDAQAYVKWLSEKTGKGYRLLNESEWEYVARAGSRTAHHWGDDIGRNRANCYGCGSRWDDKSTAPVGSFGSNGFGLYDVHGNVWEWVEDCWDASYAGAPADGSAWERGDCSHRALRSGSWYISPWYLRSAIRSSGTAGDRVSDYGFRVARTLTP